MVVGVAEATVGSDGSKSAIWAVRRAESEGADAGPRWRRCGGSEYSESSVGRMAGFTSVGQASGFLALERELRAQARDATRSRQSGFVRRRDGLACPAAVRYLRCSAVLGGILTFSDLQRATKDVAMRRGGAIREGSQGNCGGMDVDAVKKTR